MPKHKAPNKRKAKLTLAKHRDINDKKTKQSAVDSEQTIPSSNNTSNSNVSSSQSNAAICNPYYICNKSCNGIDLSMFHLANCRL